MVLINQTNVLRALIVLFALLASSVSGRNSDSDFCNICGEGNSIQYPTGVVNFQYNGQPWKQNCQTLQNVVKNPVAISDKFCRNELLAYTHAVCRCTTPNGKAVSDSFQPPTSSPAPGGPLPDAGSDVSSSDDGGSSGCSSLKGVLWISSLLFAMIIV